MERYATTRHVTSHHIMLHCVILLGIVLHSAILMLYYAICAILVLVSYYSIPKACKFYLQNHGVLDFKPGDAYKLDLVNYHTVVNDSNIPRYHIIIHGDK